MKFHIKTFGCQMNVCDSTWMDKALRVRGWKSAPESEADVILVNTCSVREKPEQKVYSLLGRLRSYWEPGSKMFVGVGGCVAQQVGEAFWHKFPHVRLVFGPDGVASVPEALEQLMEDPRLRLSLLDFSPNYLERQRVWDGSILPAQAYVNIMQGCDNFCAYCIVPYTRGRQKSRSSVAVLDECRSLLQAGVKEITLLGQNVNSYGQDRFGDGVSFAELLKKICALPGLQRLRFTTSHPKDIAPGLISAFGQLPNLCPSLHLPLQSGSNKILERMGRNYTAEHYVDIINRLRTVRPDITLSTDIIVGFPGETPEDFERTLELLRKVRFDSSFSFKYSDRPGTRAALYSDKLSEQTKAQRLKILQELQESITWESLQKKVGQEAWVLVEGPSIKENGDAPSWSGREPGGRIVNFTASEGLNIGGSMVRVKIKDAKKHSLFGRICGKHD